jgi:hypothetical protein
MPDPMFQKSIMEMRFGAYLVGLLFALLGFGVAFGWGVGLGVLGVLIVFSALLEKH